jgi:hypothetical protein
MLLKGQKQSREKLDSSRMNQGSSRYRKVMMDLAEWEMVFNTEAVMREGEKEERVERLAYGREKSAVEV